MVSHQLHRVVYKLLADLVAVGGNDADVLHTHSLPASCLVGQQALQQLDQGGSFHWVVIAGSLPIPHLHRKEKNRSHLTD